VPRSGGTIPRISERRARLFEIRDVPGDDGHQMDKRGRRNQRAPLGAQIGYI